MPMTLRAVQINRYCQFVISIDAIWLGCTLNDMMESPLADFEMVHIKLKQIVKTFSANIGIRNGNWGIKPLLDIF